MQYQYQLGHLPGGLTVGGSYAWDNEFATIQRGFVLPIRPPASENSSWAMYVSVWQYLLADDDGDDAPLDLLNGRPDRKGFGLFSRLGFADDQTNPTEIAFSGGLGGRGAIPGRDDDIYGIGYFYNDVQTDRFPPILGAQNSYQGFEAFYNIALTPAAGLTLDLQIVEPATDHLDTAVMLGARFLVRF